MPSKFLVRCSACRARIKAPGQLLGQLRNCPGCQTQILIHPQPPEDVGPILVEEDWQSLRRVSPWRSALRD